MRAESNDRRVYFILLESDLLTELSVYSFSVRGFSLSSISRNLFAYTSCVVYKVFRKYWRVFLMKFLHKNTYKRSH